MSILVEGDLAVFKLARDAVLSTGDIRQVGLFDGIRTSLLSPEQCQDVVAAICSMVAISDQRSWSRSSSKGSLYYGTSKFLYT